MSLRDDVPEVEYHAHPAFSQSRAKVLLQSPAKYKWQLDNPPPPKAVFDFGHAAHAKVLGVGDPIVTIDADSWRTKAATEAAEEARAAGSIPLLAKDAARVDAMAAQIQGHPLASAILTSKGRAEVSMWWTDPETGAECRGRVDYLAETIDGLVNVDYKSTVDASPTGFAKSCANYGYHLQAAAYEDGLKLITGEDVPSLLIAQEKEAPYLVAVYRFASFDVDAGYAKWRDALDLLVKCRAADEWPGYAPDITEITMPRWAS